MARPPVKRQARFTSGSTMGHVMRMTTVGMIGLTFMFLVDVVTLFWVSRLDSEVNMAAMGYAWSIQFFTISVAIAFMIAATALVSRSLGQERWQDAREQTTVSVILSVAALSVAVFFLLIYRYPILRAIGAEGETLDIAADFLLISVPSLPVMVVGMIGAAVLRAEGDAIRSMVGTVSAGVVAMIVDPLFIFGFDMGVQGAALGVSVSRIVSMLFSVYFVIVVKDLAAKVGWAEIKKWYKPFLIVTAPTILTQLSSPTGNYLATGVIAEYGDAAVAGWAVLGRITVLAFGGVFALSGAIGGIVGQNYGAERFDRVRSAYRDSLLFSTIYVAFVWLILILLTPFIASAFSLSAEATGVVEAFTHITAGSFAFAGALYISNASFNNLGKPVYSTVFNWIKDGLLMLPLCLLGASIYGARGVVYGQGAAWLLAGLVAAFYGWRFINQVEQRTITSSAKGLNAT